MREDHLNVIAPLDILAAPGRDIHPFLAELRGYEGTFSPDEVQEVFTVPFAHFLQNEPIRHYTRSQVEPEDPDALYGLLGVEGYPWFGSRSEVLFYPCGDKLIWGMTAQFVHNLVTLYRESQLPQFDRK